MNVVLNINGRDHDLFLEVIENEVCNGDNFVCYAYEVDVNSPCLLYTNKKHRKIDLKKASKNTINEINLILEEL